MANSIIGSSGVKTIIPTSSQNKTVLSALGASRDTINNAVKSQQRGTSTAEKKQQAQLDSLMALNNQQSQQLANALSQINAYNDVEARINALNEAKKVQAVADLGKARETQLSNLASEEYGIKPMYNNQRNATAATNMSSRRTLAEELASRGETNSGVADEANIRANMSLQNNLGTLNTQEASDIADISRRKTGIENAYQSDVASARAGLDAATMQNLINQYNADKQFKLQEASLTGKYNGGQTLDALNASRNFALNEAGLTGSYNGGQTLASQNQAFNQNLETKQYNQQAKQQELDNLYRQQAFDYQKSRDVVSDTQWQKTMNLNLREQSFQETQQNIQNALSQQRISQEDATQALQWAKFNAETDPNSLDNLYKRAQTNSINSETNASAYPTLNEYSSKIDAAYVTGPSSANGYQKTVNTQGVRDYLKMLLQAGVPDAIVNSLGDKYGIQ